MTWVSRQDCGAAPSGPDQWLEQADYDMDTAFFMFTGGRYFYAVFMCHLALEKALKGLYLARLGRVPPKTHSLVQLLTQVGAKPDEAVARFLVTLNAASVATRYPEDLRALQENYTADVVSGILANGKEALGWIRAQF